ncbi:hypothetical protein WA1_50395 [Scytonema hofmannii PCC 7110]|uniref:DUF5895 domain-containing protein n=1 Tax=Scytonema hofmannii PCC 7110 TaxID=128403 RepID=A0A139WR76_9CYAN|nr:DUF5895 domain-containing protein [Scytonema hofmannii]KYC34936.1 hypothetical protein WA1_50395 [Scytonema hofmannii PCC 7110]
MPNKTENAKTQTPNEVNEANELNEPTEPTESNEQETDAEYRQKAEKYSLQEYTGTLDSIPICQILNEKDTPGLFVKEKVLGLIGWMGSEPNYEHTFRSGSVESGVLFKSPKMHVVTKSLRLIEDRETKEILASYETPEGKQLYEELKEKEQVTLRTLYLIYLVGDNQKLLHEIPLILSVKGIAAARFGEALKEFRVKLEVAYGRFMKQGYSPKDKRFHSMGIFCPTFTASLEPKEATSKEKKSWVAVIGSYAAPNADGSNIRDFLNVEETREQTIHPLAGSEQYFSKPLLKAAENTHKQLEEPEIPPESLQTSQPITPPVVKGTTVVDIDYENLPY